jgi:ketosteroid isomerase-like protein
MSASRMDHDGLAALVRELADRRAIEDGVICYAHALDSRDYARLRECIAADARVHYGRSGWLDGVDAAAQYCARSLALLDRSQHRIGTVDVKLDGDRAASTAYVCAEHVRDGRRFTVGGRYLDRWARTPAGWRIVQRELVVDWTDGDPEVLRPPPRA